MNRILVDALAKAGKVTKTWASSDGSTVLVLPHGGRILGLFSPGSEQNFLWTNPALDRAETAAAFYQSADWHNSGGDRTWIAPEVDFFLPNYPKLDVYVQPRAFDPGDYQLTDQNGEIVLTNVFACELSRSHDTAHLKLSKRISAAANPLHAVGSPLFDRVQYAGYALHTRLEFTSGRAEPPQVGLWSLLQLPHRGELFIPTFSKTRVRTYFGDIDAEDLAVSDHLIRYRMKAAGEQKIGLEAPTVIGRAGYLQALGEESSLVIRNFSINPSGRYIDVPWGEPEASGSAIEACNVDSKWGCFSELEYHSPAIGGPGGDWCCEDTSQLWAFRGPEQSIYEILRLLV
jgi:hypothetical protein